MIICHGKHGINKIKVSLVVEMESPDLVNTIACVMLGSTFRAALTLAMMSLDFVQPVYTHNCI